MRNCSSWSFARGLPVRRLCRCSTQWGGRQCSLITPIWSSARSGHQTEFGNMTKRQEDGLLKLIGDGCGIAGWHGHMGDAFRDRATCHFLIGGQFVAHPPGWLDNLRPCEDYIDNDVKIWRTDDPALKGIWSFRLTTEQYYMLVDPSNEVLATTTFLAMSESRVVSGLF